MNPISKVRFEALAGYCRLPGADIAGIEISWFEAANESVLGFVLRDRSDGDFSGMILARDALRRFRWIGDTNQFYPTSDEAERALAEKIEYLLNAGHINGVQGDERGRPVDFFGPRVALERRSDEFAHLADSEGYSPAKEIIRPMMHWYGDRDGNFIEQFQTTGFDARIFELYLFATFVEAGYAISERTPIPDFTCSRFGNEFCVEATTVGPSTDGKGKVLPLPPLNTLEEIRAFQREYMPIRFAGPLMAKLHKKYWERENVAGRPLLLAIEDFHGPGTLLLSRPSLPIYLYGYEHSYGKDDTGRLHIEARRVEAHRWGNKMVPSGFFSRNGAENISAVIFTNSGTIAKFNRMGVVAGFGSRSATLVREGFIVDHDPHAIEPIKFAHHVNSTGYTESWIEGLDVFHNPNATFPLPDDFLPGAAHHRMDKSGKITSMVPDWHPLVSITSILVPYEA